MAISPKATIEDFYRLPDNGKAEIVADDFAAGTLVVWDADRLSHDTIKICRAHAPDQPVIYRRGEIAEAEPALPGWRMPADEVLAKLIKGE